MTNRRIPVFKSHISSALQREQAHTIRDLTGVESAMPQGALSYVRGSIAAIPVTGGGSYSSRVKGERRVPPVISSDVIEGLLGVRGNALDLIGYRGVAYAVVDFRPYAMQNAAADGEDSLASTSAYSMMINGEEHRIGSGIALVRITDNFRGEYMAGQDQAVSFPANDTSEGTPSGVLWIGHATGAISTIRPEGRDVGLAVRVFQSPVSLDQNGLPRADVKVESLSSEPALVLEGEHPVRVIGEAAMSLAGIRQNS